MYVLEDSPETVTLFSQEEINNDDQELDDVSLHRIEGAQNASFYHSTPVYRDKGTRTKKRGRSLQHYPHPLNLRSRGPYQFPTLLNT